MKRLIVIVLLLCGVLCAYAGIDCTSSMIRAKLYYSNHQYDSAILYYSFCRDNCPDYNKKADSMINECEKAKAKELKAKEQRWKDEKYKELAQRRKNDGYLYFSAFSEVPGSFQSIESALKNGFHTADSVNAYWFVHVAVTIQDESNNEHHRYRVLAALKVENADESDYEVKSYFWEKKGMCSIAQHNPATYVADLIFDSKYDTLFKEIQDKIVEFTGTQKMNNTNVDSFSYIRKKENVSIHIVNSLPCDNIIDDLESRLIMDFNKADNRFNVLQHNTTIDSIIKREYLYQERGYLERSQQTLEGHRFGADKVCVVEIKKGRGNDFVFYFSVIDIRSNTVERVDYPRSNEDPMVYSNSDKETVQIVADALALQLGLLSEQQVSDLNESIQRISKLQTTLEFLVQDMRCEEEKAIDRIKRTDNILSCFPGIYQLKYKKQGGALFLTGELLSIGGIIVTQNLRNVNIKKMNGTTNVDLKRAYADKANTFTILRDVSIGAAAAIWIWSFVDARISIHNKHNQKVGNIVIKPAISDESAALSLSINF